MFRYDPDSDQILRRSEMTGRAKKRTWRPLPAAMVLMRIV